MIEQSYRIAGDEVCIHVLERDEDLSPMREWFASHGRGPIALDTETTGLGVWQPDFAVRLVQMGDGRDSWVVPVERFSGTLRAILGHKAYRWILHNASFDILALRATGLLEEKAESFVRRVDDTKILSHLIDPRGQTDGGIGHGLKPLAEHYVDPSAPDTQAGLKEAFREIKVPSGRVYKTKKKDHHDVGDPIMRGATEDEGWRLIDLFHPVYTLYAGLDTLLTYRLYERLTQLVREHGVEELYRFERAVQRVCLQIQARGMRLDVPYAEKLSAELDSEHHEAAARAASLGLENVSSPKQVLAAFQSRGWQFGTVDRGVDLTAKTDTGNPKVDKAVRAALAKAGDPLAQAISDAKSPAKARVAYVEAMLSRRDKNDRVHAQINSLHARSGRQSVSGPPLQQLPSEKTKHSDDADEDLALAMGARIRGCIVPDDGCTIVKADYAQLELRVMAAIYDVKAMKKAIAKGIDLHDATAFNVYGKDYTPENRKTSKMTNFLTVYGGGPAKLCVQADIPFESAQEVMWGFADAYPEIKANTRRLTDDVLSQAFPSPEELAAFRQLPRKSDEQKEAARGKYGTIRSPIGRILPVDALRPYAGMNYVVQGSGADVTKRALLRADNMGLTDRLLMIVHDEILADAPKEDAEEFAKLLSEAMREEFMGVPIDAEGEVVGESWGKAYA